MNFKPKTEEQLKKERLIADGIYPFEVLDAKDGVSKAGNDMIVLSLGIYADDSTNDPRQFTDFLMEKMMYKLLHFCRETGLGEKYEAGTLQPEDCVGKTGYLKMKTQVRKDTGESQNSVADYVPKPGNDPAAQRRGPTDEQLTNKTKEADEDVPF